MAKKEVTKVINIYDNTTKLLNFTFKDKYAATAIGLSHLDIKDGAVIGNWLIKEE